jgi:hypothetical protein
VSGLGSQSGGRPNILLITSDEERYTLPHPDGFVLPATSGCKSAWASPLSVETSPLRR